MCGKHRGQLRDAVRDMHRDWYKWNTPRGASPASPEAERVVEGGDEAECEREYARFLREREEVERMRRRRDLERYLESGEAASKRHPERVIE